MIKLPNGVNVNNLIDDLKTFSWEASDILLTYSDVIQNSEKKLKILNIIINFGVLTTGFDAPKSNVAIIGRPTQSVTLYSQMIGRVMRGKKAGGNESCKVVTVKDPIYGFRDMSESFEYWEELWD